MGIGVTVNISQGGATITPAGGGLGSFSSFVEIDARALASYLGSDQGPVMRSLIKAGDEVKAGAIARVGVDTGNLRDHIVLVGADVDYAIYHHEGSDATTKLIRFKPKGSSVFIVRLGRRAIPGNPFLTDALAAVRI
jgi:hypothetical protein